MFTGSRSSGAESLSSSCTTPGTETWWVAPSFNILSADSRGSSDLMEGPVEGGRDTKVRCGLGRTSDLNRLGSLCGMLEKARGRQLLEGISCWRSAGRMLFSGPHTDTGLFASVNNDRVRQGSLFLLRGSYPSA